MSGVYVLLILRSSPCHLPKWHILTYVLITGINYFTFPIAWKALINITWIVPSDLIPWCFKPDKHPNLHTPHRNIEMQSLGYACIFCTSNSRGQQTYIASYIISGNVLLSWSSFFYKFQKLLESLPGQTIHFHCNNFNMLPNFVYICW